MVQMLMPSTTRLEVGDTLISNLQASDTLSQLKPGLGRGDRQGATLSFKQELVIC